MVQLFFSHLGRKNCLGMFPKYFQIKKSFILFSAINSKNKVYLVCFSFPICSKSSPTWEAKKERTTSNSNNKFKVYFCLFQFASLLQHSSNFQFKLFMLIIHQLFFRGQERKYYFKRLRLYLIIISDWIYCYNMHILTSNSVVNWKH